ncbi:unnamed protein product [Ilex paraguariensis]|uniref:Uncharacterized protein n=1 Tax=Ilex paraguariensis TaxID=185542 RepID=A0ABC8RDL1_9AQUA
MHVSLTIFQERFALSALLDRATSYVNQLKEKIEELKKRKEQVQLQGDGDAIEDQRQRGGLMLPVLSIREVGSTLEINLITGMNVNQSCMLNKIFRLLQEEGAQVVSASYSTVGSRTFYSVYSQALYSRIGVDTSRIIEKLQTLVNPVAQQLLG